MLKQLQELKQGQKDIEDLLVEFENLKLLAKISNNHAMEIMQLNVQWETMKQFVLLYRPLASYQGLKTNLLDLDKIEAYIKTIHHPTFTNPFHPHTSVPQTPAHQLLQGMPMNIDHQ